MKLGREITNVSSIRFGRAIITPAQLLFVVLCLFFVSGAWGACTVLGVQWVSNNSCGGTGYYGSNCDYSFSVPSCNSFEGCTVTTPASSGGSSCVYVDVGPQVNCWASGYSDAQATYYGCGSKCEADSLQCVNSGETWDSENCECNRCDDECKCEEEGGIWVESNGGYCVPNCKNKNCCDSLNKTLPTETTTDFLGCQAEDPTSDKCVVYASSITSSDSTLAAECNGLSLYETCTVTYIWATGKNSDGRQCVPVPSYNCRKWSQRDSLCTNVICTAYQQHSLSSLTYNGSTGCYEGLETVNDMLTCSNGNVQFRGSYTRNFTVCDSYLDSIGTNISDYLAGQTGSGPGTGLGGSTGGSGGGSGGSGSSDGSSNGMTDGFEGGTSTNNLGETVVNSPSPGLGGYITTVPQVVTATDSATGETVVVKNSSGGDSVVNVNQFFELECLGVAGGVATLTNGTSTWTCEAMTCGAALISARLNGGTCSANYNGINPYSDDEENTVVTITGDTSLQTGYEYYDFQKGLDAIVVALNGIENKDTLNREKVAGWLRNQQDSLSDHMDSLWRWTFGDSLDAVRNFEQYISAASSANSNSIASAASHVSSANSNAIGSAASSLSVSIGNVETSVTNMKTRVVNAIESASSANSNAIADAAILISSANSRAIASASSVNSNAIASAVSSIRSTFMDSVRHTNELLEGISISLDTESYINRGIHKLDSSVLSLPYAMDSAYRISFDNIWNDKIKITMDSNARMVADAIDSLKVDVKLDSIKVDVPHDSLLDSINDNLKSMLGNYRLTDSVQMVLQPESLNLGAVIQSVYDSTVGDTFIVYDSSFAEHMRQVASTTIDGSDVSDTYVDSVENTLSSRLDSSRNEYNLRSDSAVNAYRDSMMKYYGVDSIGRALNDFFGGYSDGCPRDCINIKMNGPAITGGKDVTVNLAYYICDLQIIGSYTVLDFIKLVLKIYTAFLCMTLLLQAVPLGKGGKK